MSATQRIVRVRRQYNQWVADQSLEDYALRFTGRVARRWLHFRVANTAIGSISFLALEAIGGLITLQYGFTNAVYAIAVVSTLIFLSSLAIAYYAASYGLDIDLLTRGAGFGYLGSSLSSLIYAIFTFVFFAIEAAIMAVALEMGLGIPLQVGYALSSLIIIPLVAYGITLISRLQLWTQPIWVVLQLAPFLALAIMAPDNFRPWVGFGGGDEARLRFRGVRSRSIRHLLPDGTDRRAGGFSEVHAAARSYPDRLALVGRHADRPPRLARGRRATHDR